MKAPQVIRITVTLDEALHEGALELADPGLDKTGLSRKAIMNFIRVQTAKRRAALGSNSPEMADISPQRRDASP